MAQKRKRPLILLSDPFEVEIAEFAGSGFGSQGSLSGSSAASGPGGGGGSGGGAGGGGGAGAGGGGGGGGGEPDDDNTPPTAIILKIISGMAPVITMSPSSEVVEANTDASFTVAATGTGPLIYQWYVTAGSGGNAWNPIPGAASATLTLPNVPQGDTGNKYRCVVSNAFGSANSGAAFLFVNAPADGAPYIITDPVNAAGLIGDTVIFAATASGTPIPDYQWQISTDGGSTFTDLSDGGEYSGTQTDVLSVAGLTLGDQGNLFRASATNTGGSCTSNSASLTVGDPVITNQPEAANGIEGDTVSFSVSAEGATSLDYQWQISTNNGGSYSNLSDAGKYSGSSTDTLQVGPIDLLTDDGNLFRCIVSDTNGTAFSDAAGLTVNLPPLGFSVEIPSEVRIINTSGVNAISSGSISPVFTGGYPPFTALAGGLTNSVNYADSAIFVPGDAGEYEIELTAVSGAGDFSDGMIAWVGFVGPSFVDSEGSQIDPGDPGYTNLLNMGIMVMPSNANVLGTFSAQSFDATGSPTALSGVQPYNAANLGNGFFTGGILVGSISGDPAIITLVPPNGQTVQGTTTSGSPLDIILLGALIFVNYPSAYLTPIGQSHVVIT